MLTLRNYCIVFICVIFCTSRSSSDNIHLSSIILPNHKIAPSTLCPVGLNGQICSGVGKCNLTTNICHCPTHQIGSSCQYHRHLMTCTNHRYCVQCRVHATGPFAEDNGCEEFCRDHPRPVIVDHLSVRKHEIVCSFIDSTNATNICRFYFKLTNLQTSEEESPYSRGDVFVIAQKTPECESVGGRQWVRDDSQLLHHDTGPGYATMFFIFLFVALPFVACMASCVQNFRSLPCGLCNPIRKPSSTYLRNVRPYPGTIIESSIPDNHIVINQ